MLPTRAGNYSLTNLANRRSISFGYDFRGPEVHETYFRVKRLETIATDESKRQRLVQHRLGDR